MWKEDKIVVDIETVNKNEGGEGAIEKGGDHSDEES